MKQREVREGGREEEKRDKRGREEGRVREVKAGGKYKGGRERWREEGRERGRKEEKKGAGTQLRMEEGREGRGRGT